MINKIRHNCLFVIGLIVILMLATACNKNAADANKAKEEKTAIPVEAAQVKRGAVSANYNGTTTLEAQDEAVVVAKVSGVIKKIMVEEGQVVNAGQVLAKLEDEQFGLAVAEAESKLNQLASEFKRNERLYQDKIVGEDAYERIKSQYETQKSLYSMAKLNLAYTEIKAPISGVVSDRMIKVGNMLTINQSTFRITNFDPLWAVLHVPEKELSKLRVGYPASLSADALPGKAYQAKILRISPVVISGSGTFKVTLEVRDQTRELKPGMFTRVNIVYDVHQNTLLVPKDAILTEDIESSIFVVKEKVEEPEKEKKTATKDLSPAKGAYASGTPAKPKKYLIATKQPVTIGYINTTHVEILSGAKVGDRVVTAGLSSLKDGARIKIVGK